jgi:ATP-binding cassette, subfamily B, bacterial HlyB/CyaB
MSDVSPAMALLRYPLFARLGPAVVDRWLQTGQEVSHATGETMVEAGRRGRHVFVVLAGRVRVVRSMAEGGEHFLGSFRTGEVFGEYALVPPYANTAACRAAEPTRLLRLPLLFLTKHFEQFPPGGPNIKCWMRLHAIARLVRDQACLGFQTATSFVPWLERCEEITFEPGEALQAIGLNADRWFVLQSGRARWTAAGRCPDLLPGDTFGEGALVGAADLPLVEAIESGTCLALCRDVFDCLSAEESVLQSEHLHRLRPAAAWVPQASENDCGAAALAMAARQLGLDTTVETLRCNVATSAAGATLAELRRAAVALGLLAEAVRIAPRQLRHVSGPAVAHLKNNHYVTLFEASPMHVVIGDPALGVRTMTPDEFTRMWSGQVLLLTSPSESAVAEASRHEIARFAGSLMQTWRPESS